MKEIQKTDNKKEKKKKAVNNTQDIPENKPLTHSQKRLIKEYLMDPIRGKYSAYVRAGYKGRGKVGIQIACRIFNFPHVKKKIDEELKKLQSQDEEDVKVSFNWTIDHLRAIVDFDIRDLYTHDGRLRGIWELTDNAAKAISSIEMANYPVPHNSNKKQKEDVEKRFKAYIKKIKKWDKLRALEMIIELMGFKDAPKESADELAGLLRKEARKLLNSIPPKDRQNEESTCS